MTTEQSAEAETQESIARWATETFGPAPSNKRIVTRANEELADATAPGCATTAAMATRHREQS